MCYFQSGAKNWKKPEVLGVHTGIIELFEVLPYEIYYAVRRLCCLCLQYFRRMSATDLRTTRYPFFPDSYAVVTRARTGL